MMATRNLWKEYMFECCSDCGKSMESSWSSSRSAFGQGKRFVALEPGTYTTDLSHRDMAALHRNSFARHRLPYPLTGYNPDGPAPWEEENTD